MSLPIFTSSLQELALMQTSWASLLNPLLDASTSTGSSGNLPSGIVIAYVGATAPSGWLLCDGSPVSRIAYSDLFKVIGITHGKGDGQSTFNLPDYRGRFLRGVTGTSSNDPDAASRSAMATGGNTGDNVGSVQADALQGHFHSTASLYPARNGGGAQLTAGTLYSEFQPITATAPITDGVNGTPRTTSETRPKNAYVNFIVKT